MAGLGWVGAYGSIGAGDALEKILKDREMKKQLAFENQLKTRAADLADVRESELHADRMDSNAWRSSQAKQAQANHDETTTLANREMYPPQTFLGNSDPQMPKLQKYVRGTMRPVPAVPAMGPDFQGPSQNDLSPEQAQVGREGGALTLPTQKQAATATDDTRMADRNASLDASTAASLAAITTDRTNRTADREADNKRQGDIAMETNRHNLEMERLRQYAIDNPRPTAAAGSRPMPASEASKISDLDNSIDEAATLGKLLMPADANGAALPGPTGTASWWGTKMPNFTGLGNASKATEATIGRVRQVIGKAFEGGVLRKEDEIKYEKILPTIGDPDAVVASKMKGLDAALRQRRERELSNLRDAGYDVSKFPENRSAPMQVPTQAAPAAPPAAPRSQPPLTPGQMRGRLRTAPAPQQASPATPAAQPPGPAATGRPQNPTTGQMWQAPNGNMTMWNGKFWELMQ